MEGVDGLMTWML